MRRHDEHDGGWLHEKLRFMGLRPLLKAGMHRFGESVVTGVSNVVKGRFFTDITFMDSPPNAEMREYTVRFNRSHGGCDGAVVFVELNGSHCLIVRQWRKCGRWTHEVPRGFADPSDNGRILAVLERDIGRHAIELLRVNEITELGEFDENTGTSNISPRFVFVRAEAELKELTTCYAKNAPIKLEAWPYDRLWTEMGLKIRDLHSITAVALARRHVEA